MSYKQSYYQLGQSEEVDNFLRSEAEDVLFPLSKSDLETIALVEAQFDAEENCSGIAAPQIGIAKKIIIFSTPEDPNLKKFRPDWTDSMPKTLWINPSYEGIEESGKTKDYEACFSVPSLAGLVERWTEIKYKAYDADGNIILGQAKGFLARIIQHEIDHVYGKLFIDIADKDSIKTLDQYRADRKAAIES
ncbi:MAG UNVERIFIED_CONTAM: peptide deformylase [Rickettsiaceae bacterium]|jgi:peptide deformylase